MHLAPDWANLTDDALVEEAQNGSDPAFAELVRRHRNGCMKLAMSVLKCWPDAEDEVQNAFWKAFCNIREFHRDARFGTWLTRIVVKPVPYETSARPANEIPVH